MLQVESLLAERQQLSGRLCVLQKDNDQLAELVGRLARTVQVSATTTHLLLLDTSFRSCCEWIDAGAVGWW